MTGCHTCGGYGMHHDPIAHGTACPNCGKEWRQCTCCDACGATSRQECWCREEDDE